MEFGKIGMNSPRMVVRRWDMGELKEIPAPLMLKLKQILWEDNDKRIDVDNYCVSVSLYKSKGCGCLCFSDEKDVLLWRVEIKSKKTKVRGLLNLWEAPLVCGSWGEVRKYFRTKITKKDGDLAINNPAFPGFYPQKRKELEVVI